MTVYSVIAAAIVRKIKALVAEYRKLVAEATAVEQKLISEAKAEVTKVITAAKNEEQRLIAEAKLVIKGAASTKASIHQDAKPQTDKLRNDLIDKIAKV